MALGQLVTSGYICSQLVTAGHSWSNLDTLVPADHIGHTWSQLYSPGPSVILDHISDIWSQLVTQSYISHSWSHLITTGHNWSHLVRPGHIFSHLVTPGHTWQQLVTSTKLRAGCRRRLRRRAGPRLPHLPARTEVLSQTRGEEFYSDIVR